MNSDEKSLDLNDPTIFYKASDRFNDNKKREQKL